MNLSSRTIDVLKNFCNINTQILFKPGNVVCVVDKENTLSGRAVIPEEFPQEFAIYDVPQFLNSIGLFNNPNLEFHETYVKIGHAKQAVKYLYSDPEYVHGASYKTFSTSVDSIEFTLEEEVLKQMLKAAAILNSPIVSFHGEGEAIDIRAIDPVQGSSKMYSRTIFEKEGADFNFDSRLKIEHLKMISSNYNVTLYGEICARFTTDAGKGDTLLPVEYYLALQTKR